jgi:hypothetical protein
LVGAQLVDQFGQLGRGIDIRRGALFHGRKPL